MAEDIHKVSVSKGFWDEEPTIHFMLSKLALVHSEVSEVLEAMRKEMGEEKVVEELVDIYIRLMDFYQGAKNSGWVKSSFDEVYENKMNKNKQRPAKHGNLA
jgi:NTP pyrophosphatase (non-canonical NTP hydrolase)